MPTDAGSGCVRVPWFPIHEHIARSENESRAESCLDGIPNSIADQAFNHDVFLTVLVGIICSLAENAT